MIYRYAIRLIVLLVTGSMPLAASTIPTQSVVKIYASIAQPDYKHPWQTSRIMNVTGSGAIIDDHMLLTAAHVVSGAKFIEVTKENDPKKYVAELRHISHQADLALLEVKDETFFSGTKPLQLNPIAKHRDEVTVLGYPIGGNAISTTTGVISRIEYIAYAHSKAFLLGMQLDAAINSGNSGGPAVNGNGELVGIAMQKLHNANNIAYIVPSIIIATFLDDVKDGRVDGFHSNGTAIRSIENRSMKEYYGLDDTQGVLVTFADKQDTELKPNDVILAIDGKKIANNGTIETDFGRIDFRLALHTKQVGDAVTFEILRDRKIIEVPYTLKYEKPLIATEFARDPRYLIFGGLLFSPLTQNYILTLAKNAVGFDMLYYEQAKTKEFEEPVVWMQTIFPHDVNRGYSSGAETVQSVNGIKVKNFAHFVKLVDDADAEYIVLDMVEKKNVVLNRKAARESFSQLQRIYGLNSDRRVE